MPSTALESQEDEDVVIPGPIPLSRSVKIAAEYLAACVHADHGARHGKTALYWNLIGVVLQHAKEEP